jgi:multicomponent Na+:H+ antiporter subunit E
MPAAPLPGRGAMLDDGRHHAVAALLRAEAPPAPPGPAPARRRAAALAAGLLAALWAGLTGGDAGSWVIGLPAVLAGAAIAGRLAPARLWRLSASGALGFAGWFALQAVRGALDVARRAFDPRLPLAPGWRRHPLTLPPGAPRLVLANAVTLLPGTLTAELARDHLVVHMLDTRADLAADLAPLEARVRALFALPPAPTPSRPERQP